jgi:hypothetical protein
MTQRKAQSPLEDPVVAERWAALVRYDDEIRAAAEQLIPFGNVWVEELGRAFFALAENREYLPKIVTRLLEDAKNDRIQRWLEVFGRTANGEPATEESLKILLAAQAQGYSLEIGPDKAFVLTKGSSTSYVRSNYDIQRFAELAKLVNTSPEGNKQ